MNQLATIHEPPFRFGTKAQTLEQLGRRLKTAKTCPQYAFTVQEWQTETGRVLDEIRTSFDGSLVIVRGSAQQEDVAEASRAAAFTSIPQVSVSDSEALVQAIEKIIESYMAQGLRRISANQVLIQPMVSKICVRGALSTRDVSTNGPYLVIHYDEISDGENLLARPTPFATHLRIFRGAAERHTGPAKTAGTANELPANAPAFVEPLLEASREIESITGSETLEIEFAVTKSGDLYVFQVRPIGTHRAASGAWLYHNVAKELADARQFLTSRCAPHRAVLGKKSILGRLPDGNPADVIGDHPKPLAFALYRHVMQRKAWREARALIGYRNPHPQSLMVCVAGKPYQDLRASFNSLIPAALPDALGAQLVEYYLSRVSANPELRSENEFDLAYPCLTLDAERRHTELAANGFSDAQIDMIETAAEAVTERMVIDPDQVASDLELRVERLRDLRRAAVKEPPHPVAIPGEVELLLEDCIQLGALPLAVSTQYAMVARAFLRSLGEEELLSAQELEDYLESLEHGPRSGGGLPPRSGSSPLSPLSVIDQWLSTPPISSECFDITSATYAESTDAPPPPWSQPSSPTRESVFSVNGDARIAERLRTAGFLFTIGQLDRFIRGSIRLQHAAQLEFTKSLRSVLDRMVEFGRYHGLGREDLSYLDLELFLSLADQNCSRHSIANLRDLIERNKARYDLTATIRLPNLILGEQDLEWVT